MKSFPFTLKDSLVLSMSSLVYNKMTASGMLNVYVQRLSALNVNINAF